MQISPVSILAMIHDQREVGEWEDRARLFLVRTAGDTSQVIQVLETLAQQFPDDRMVRYAAFFEIDRARAGLLQKDEGLHLLLLIVWDVQVKCFRPFTSPTFEAGDIALRSALVNEVVDLAIRYKSNGIAMRTFGKPSQELVQAIFGECQALIGQTQAAMANVTKH